MIKIRYIIIIFIGLGVFSTANALDIEYGNILSVKSPNVIIEYYNIGTKSNFLCNVPSGKCTTTTKSTLNKTPSPAIIKKSIKKELSKKGANHITLSKSGNFLAYYISSKVTGSNRIFVLRNMKNKKEFTLSNNVNYWDLVNEGGKVFEFSPNSKTLIYANDIDGYMSLYKVNINSLKGGSFSGEKLPLTAYSVTNFIIADDGNLYYIGNTKSNPYIWSLYHFNFKTNKDNIIESNVSYTNSIIKIGSTLIFNRLQDKGYGPKMYNTNTRKLRNFQIPNINTVASAHNEKVITTASSNAVLMMPPNNSQARPLVIWLHGGPLRQTSYGYHPYHSYGVYDSILELLRKNNVIVIKLDYRGSFGMGRNYSEKIKNSVGLGDIEDVMNAINYAKKNYNVGNVYLAGNSYGGYLSLRSLVEHPNSFAGVFSINGVTDWESLLLKMRKSIFNTQFDGLPNENNRALYDQASIISRIGNIGNQKIQIVQGEADRTIPLWQATLLYDKLKSQNKNVVLTTYPGEDHVFKEKENISDLCVQLFNFVGIPVDPKCAI